VQASGEAASVLSTAAAASAEDAQGNMHVFQVRACTARHMR